MIFKFYDSRNFDDKCMSFHAIYRVRQLYLKNLMHDIVITFGLMAYWFNFCFNNYFNKY